MRAQALACDWSDRGKFIKVRRSLQVLRKRDIDRRAVVAFGCQRTDWPVGEILDIGSSLTKAA